MTPQMRYATDVRFHKLVDAIERKVIDGRHTLDDLREAVTVLLDAPRLRREIVDSEPIPGEYTDGGKVARPTITLTLKRQQTGDLWTALETAVKVIRLREQNAMMLMETGQAACFRGIAERYEDLMVEISCLDNRRRIGEGREIKKGES